MKLSVIIPVLNEAQQIGALIRHVRRHGTGEVEVIVVDGGSRDDTASRAEAHGAKVLTASRARRSCQMNLGARAATGEVLYFVHADCLPPESFAQDIRAAVVGGFPAGCFRRRLDSGGRFLKVVSFISRFRGAMFRGGDASLYVTRDLFDLAGRFDEELCIMEDFEILRRLKRNSSFRILPKYVLASDRKHRENNSAKVNFANALVFAMYYLGFPQDRLIATYQRFVPRTRYRK